MTDYYLEAVEPQYVTTDIEFKNGEIHRMEQKNKSMSGLEDCTRLYRVKRCSDDEEIVEIEDDFQIAEQMVILLNKGVIEEQQVQDGYVDTKIQEQFEEMMAV